MALPPSKLKEILYTCHGADAVVDTLVEAGCLTRAARGNRAAMLALVANANQACDAYYEGSAGMCGPNHVDFLSDALEAADVLNRRGRRLAEEMPI